MTRWGSVSTLRALQTTRIPRSFCVANTKSAEKAARRAETNRTRNVALRSRMRSALRKVNDALASGKKADATAALKEAQPIIDSLVNKNVIHRNKAARHKSALSARIKALK